MRNRFAVFALALFVAGTASAARAQGDAERVTVAELKRLAARGAVVIVDVRNDAIERKIRGAVHVPYNDLQGRAGELPREREIVTYCA
jgi:rhodanese-related sulfurtransferase